MKKMWMYAVSFSALAFACPVLAQDNQTREASNLGTALFGSAYIFVMLFIILTLILWFFLPFAVFGIKKRIEDVSCKLVILRQVLDPDGSRYAQYLAAEEAKEAAQEEAKKKTKEERSLVNQIAQVVGASRQQKEDQKLAAQSAEIDCPSCGKRQTINDLRSGVKHPCVGCGTDIVFE